ncbi:hypothetical protein CONCODRAFT_13540 [Conidiobolus coronatus NRRL 28638]|uniref:RNI-like protein n=1 Tax=Conidiobolus coronatus (strain ATCC 28846 / CBS 209.66 / NRRL 28638) TaxID=796925 RepID=A0A137NQI5_CONC2|nr:hypothetical protein CONCODRAFT_13540 [Conidiobolus coronatus NRRL 28638]|eukprot:KXN65025.1 hypothetical protein CONCODRAFT_13540 [Conidiobolus coronatus NRRL 28638]
MIDGRIDWNLILINTEIPLYLSKADIINISLTSKFIRSKFTSLIFKSLTLNESVLSNQSNYFMDKKIFEFGNFNYLTNIWIIGKNGFNRELAFKEARIDPFIKQLNAQLNSEATHFRSVSFECLDKACYYLLPITLEFLNLRTLSFNMCVVSLAQLNGILSKLSRLEILELKGTSLIISTDSNSAKEIAFPQSLISLTYINSKFSITDLPLEKPLEFLTNNNTVYPHSNHPLLPPRLPKLKKLNYFSTSFNEELIEFLQINNQIESLSIPMNYLSLIKLNQELITNLKKLKLFIESICYNHLTADNSIIPAFPNLGELNLNLMTNTELKFAGLLIKKCPKLSKLNIYSNNLDFKNVRELTKYANNLKYFTVNNIKT